MLLKLFDADSAVRLASAQKLQSNPNPAMVPLLARALEQERDLLVVDDDRGELRDRLLDQPGIRVHRLGDAGMRQVRDDRCLALALQAAGRGQLHPGRVVERARRAEEERAVEQVDGGRQMGHRDLRSAGAGRGWTVLPTIRT